MKGTNVTVLGAGVIGLATALELAKEGYGVQVLADQFGEHSTSGVAGAIWFPYRIGNDPDERTYRWARDTYLSLLELGKDSPNTGVMTPLPLYYFGDDGPADRSKKPDWARGIPGEAVEWVKTRKLPDLLQRYVKVRSSECKSDGAWRLAAPIVHPERHLAWLRSQLGDRIDLVPTVTDLSTITGDFVINCTGRRARSLVPDTNLKPVFGQIVVTRDKSFPRSFAFADARETKELIYLIPRGGDVVLGGFDLELEDTDATPWTSLESPPSDGKYSGEILSRFEALGLKRPKEYSALAEWRPRHVLRVRVERKGRVIHNYGHGGAGFTLAYGCAKEILRELQKE